MNLPDALLERVRERAASEHRTVTSLVEEALRLILDGRPHPAPGLLPTDGLPSGRFLVDIDDKDALQAVFDEEDLKDLAQLPSIRR